VTTAEELQRQIEAEREQLAGAVDALRGELSVIAKMKAKLPLLAGGAVATGAAMRLFRRSRGK
jgi:hypothetical protein